jgi:hypothetical protein
VGFTHVPDPLVYFWTSMTDMGLSCPKVGDNDHHAAATGPTSACDSGPAAYACPPTAATARWQAASAARAAIESVGVSGPTTAAARASHPKETSNAGTSSAGGHVIARDAANAALQYASIAATTARADRSAIVSTAGATAAATARRIPAGATATG